MNDFSAEEKRSPGFRFRVDNGRIAALSVTSEQAKKQASSAR